MITPMKTVQHPNRNARVLAGAINQTARADYGCAGGVSRLGMMTCVLVSAAPHTHATFIRTGRHSLQDLVAS